MRCSTPELHRHLLEEAGKIRDPGERVNHGRSTNRRPNQLQERNLLHDVPVHVGEPEISARVAEGQRLVIEAHEMENRGVEIVDVDGILHDVDSQFVGHPVGHSAFDAPARHPDGEPVGVMIASHVVLVDGQLNGGSPAHFASPDDQGVLQHVALLQIG